MKPIRLALSLFLVLLLLLTITPISSLGAGTADTPCEIMQVYGGKEGIVSMTFDDGYYETAVLLDELFKKYNLVGTIMMKVTSLENSEGELTYAKKWQELISEGTLTVQNHSYTHANLSSGGDVANQNEEVFYREFIKSREVLEVVFPGTDIITFATPYGDMSELAYEYAKDEYFAIRTTRYGRQTLDPSFDDSLGSWKNIYSPAVVPHSEGIDQWTWIKGAIDNAAGGWYVPIIHRVGDVELTDLPYDVADTMFSYIASLRDAGKVWVTDFATATKYIRERQNVAATLKEVDGTLFLSAKMKEYTADNLYLDPEIFDTPLTVRVPITDNYTSVYYTVDGVEYIAEPFVEGGSRYAYVNIKPNTELALRSSYSHTIGDYEKCDEENHKKVCSDCGYTIYYEHSFNEGEVTLEPTHMAQGERTCICTVCGEDGIFSIPKIETHTFDKEVKRGEYLANYATCTTSREYYYSCECGERGTKTFFSGNPLGHAFRDWQIITEPTDTKDGLKKRSCRCGEEESEIIPRLGQGADQNGTQDSTSGENTDNRGRECTAKTLYIILICVVATVTTALTVYLLIKSSKKKEEDKKKRD